MTTRLPKKILKDLELLQCPHEKAPLKLKDFRTIIEKIPCPGHNLYSFDYGLRFKGELQPILWERKSASDAAMTFTAGRERFEDKLAVASKSGVRIYLLLEYDCSNVFSMRLYSKVSRLALLTTPLSLSLRFGVVPLFCTNKTRAGAVLKGLVESYARNFLKN